MIQFEECKRFSPVLLRNHVVYTSIGGSHTLSAVILHIYNLINISLKNSPCEISISKINVIILFQIFTVACVFIWTILCWRGWGPLQNNLMVFTWIIGLTGYKKGGKLVTSACSWSQKICTVTSFQKFALKTGLYKSNCQCKVCNKNYNVSCFLTFNYLVKRQSENRYTIDVLYTGTNRNHKRYTCNDINFIDVQCYVEDFFLG